jgi:hypothetical protein
VREFDDVDKAYVAFASVNPTHIVQMKFGQLSKLLLGELASYCIMLPTPSPVDPGGF